MAEETTPKKSNSLPLVIGVAIVALMGAGYFANKASQSTKAEMQATAPEAAATEPSAQEAQKAAEAKAQESAQSTAAASSTPSAENPTIALVNGKNILKSEVVAFVETLPEQLKQMPADQLFAVSQEQLVNAAIVDEKVAGSDIRSSQEFKDKLADVEKQLARGLYMQRELEASITQERLKKAYDEHVSKLPKIEETKARHILVKDEAKAKEIIEKLKTGAKFEDLAKEFSEDKSSETGDLGYFAKSDMVPEFADAAFKMAPGSLSDAPVKTQFGWHVIKVEDRRVRPTPELKDLKPVLDAELRRQTMETLMKDWRSASKVELFDETGKPVQANPAPAANTEQTQPEPTPAPAEQQ